MDTHCVSTSHRQQLLRHPAYKAPPVSSFTTANTAELGTRQWKQLQILAFQRDEHCRAVDPPLAGAPMIAEAEELRLQARSISAARGINLSSSAVRIAACFLIH